MMNFLLELVHGLRIADLLDITFISILIYLLLTWLRGMASRYVVLGIGFLGLVYVFSRLFHLYLTSFILQAFFAVFLFAMIVIFQEDLRRFFERIAIWRVKSRERDLVSSNQEADILIRAAVSLAQKRIGTLMVVQGEEPLDRHLKGGIFLKGRISEALLESIFDPHSAGHDGAVVINRGKVVKFGCHLPLSTDFAKIGNLGTRHSAALGLSECSDALCIVISEEQGSISLAHEGRLKRVSEVNQLKALIEKFYQKRSSPKSPKAWKERILEHLPEKAIALFFACGLWFVFGHTETIRRDFSLPIEYRNLSPDWVIEGEKPKDVAVTFSGPEWSFNRLDPGTLKLSLDMSQIQEGKQVIVLKKEIVKYPSALSVVKIEPERFYIEAYQLIPLTLPIKVQTKGTLPPGLAITDIKVIPPSVEVIGPRYLQGKAEILTKPIDLGSINDTTTLIPHLLLPSKVHLVKDKPSQVEIAILIEKISEKRDYENRQ